MVVECQGNNCAMNEEGSSITLIFYRIQPKWWREPALNVISAAAQMSNLTHVEISIGGPVHFLEPAHNISLLSKTGEIALKLIYTDTMQHQRLALTRL